MFFYLSLLLAPASGRKIRDLRMFFALFILLGPRPMGAVRNGRPRATPSSTRGPGLWLLDARSAVALERATGQVRVEGPGLVYVDEEESIATFLDLRPQRAPVSNTLVRTRTRDGLPFGFQIRTRVAFAPQRWNRQAPYMHPPLSMRHAIRAALRSARVDEDRVLAWHEIPYEIARGELQLRVAERHSDELLTIDRQGSGPDEPPLVRLRKELQAAVASRRPGFGLRLERLRLTLEEVPLEVQRQRVAVWQSHWALRLARWHGWAEERIFAEYMRARQFAQVELLQALSQALTKEEEIHLEIVLWHLLETIRAAARREGLSLPAELERLREHLQSPPSDAPPGGEPMLPWAIRALFHLPILMISLGLALAIGPVLPDPLAGRRPPSTMLVVGLLSVIFPFGFLLIHAVAFVENLYHVRRRTALAFVLRMAFPTWLIPIGWLRRLILPKAQARDGDLTRESRTSPVVRIGGPGFLIVHESNAVILERWGSFPRLVGPGEHLLEPFEHPAMVLDLRPQSRHRTVNPWTRDGIRVQCGLRIWCVLDWRGPDAENHERLIRMAYQLYGRTDEESARVDWASDLADEAAIVLAHQIATYTFDALWSPYVEMGISPPAPPRVLGDSPERQEASESPDWRIPERPPADAPTMVPWEDLRRQVQEETERIAREMGARLLYLSLEPPVPHPDIRAEVEQAWLAQWQAPYGHGWSTSTPGL